MAIRSVVTARVPMSTVTIPCSRVVRVTHPSSTAAPLRATNRPVRGAAPAAGHPGTRRRRTGARRRFARGCRARNRSRSNRQGAGAAEIGSVQRLHGARGVGIGHLDEGETTGPPRIAIADERDLLDGSMAGEERADVLFGYGERQISDVQFGHLNYPRCEGTDAREVAPRTGSEM